VMPERQIRLDPQFERRDPQLLANISPSIRQRQTAGILVLALLGILAVTWPFTTLKLLERLSWRAVSSPAELDRTGRLGSARALLCGGSRRVQMHRDPLGYA
jgi:hypothetical protein